MTTRRGGLGRGLGALIPTTAGRPENAATGVSLSDVLGAHSAGRGGAGRDGLDSAGSPVRAMVPVPGARFAEIPVTQIRANPRQPRQVFDEGALAELAHSLREVGFLQPVVVRDLGDDFELVMGERRWRAAQLAGFETVPAIVRETDDAAMLRDALLENLHREQLNPLEEGAAYAQLLEEFGVTHDELAQRIGRSRSQVTNTIRLLNLPPAVQRRVAAGVLSAGHARALLALDDADAQDHLAQRIVAEGLSVRAVEEIVAVGGAAGDGVRRRPGRASRPHSPALAELASGLSDYFETRVRVDLGRQRGKIVIEFASVDDLDRIVETMAPAVSQALTSRPRAESAELS